MAQIDLIEDRLIPLLGVGKVSVESITGKKPNTILRWTKSLSCVKIGGSWYTTKEALEEFSKKRTRKVNRKTTLSKDRLKSEAFLRARYSGGN